MFIVFKSGRPAGNLKFATYEAARSYARKLIRKKFPTWNFLDDKTNPAITAWGYEVKRV